MSTVQKLIIVFLTLFIACGERPKKEEIVDKNLIPELDGFWQRIGTIQTVKGKPVDTVYIKETDNDYKQIKVFHKGNVAWINNVYDSLADWKSGSGMYGKFKVYTDMS